MRQLSSRRASPLEFTCALCAASGAPTQRRCWGSRAREVALTTQARAGTRVSSCSVRRSFRAPRPAAAAGRCVPGAPGLARRTSRQYPEPTHIAQLLLTCMFETEFSPTGRAVVLWPRLARTACRRVNRVLPRVTAGRPAVPLSRGHCRSVPASLSGGSALSGVQAAKCPAGAARQCFPPPRSRAGQHPLQRRQMDARPRRGMCFCCPSKLCFCVACSGSASCGSSPSGHVRTRDERERGMSTVPGAAEPSLPWQRAGG